MTRYRVDHSHEVLARILAKRAVGFVPQPETARPKDEDKVHPMSIKLESPRRMDGCGSILGW